MSYWCQRAFRLCHTEFGIPSQYFAYEMISERCKFKPYTLLWANTFCTPNFLEIDSIGNFSPLWKSHLLLNKSFFPIISCHDYKLCVYFQFASCTLAKQWCIPQSVNVYRNCLKRYLICGWLYRSQHEKFKKAGFELKLFSPIFSRLISKSKVIKQVWSCKPIWHCKYCVNPWIHSKIRRSVYESVKLWK